MKRVCFVAICALGAAIAGYALGQPTQPAPGVALDYRAPEECPGAEAVAQDITRLLGDAASKGEGLSAKGVVTRTTDGYRLQLELVRGDNRSHRELESKSCTTLAETAALLTALAVDPDAVSRAQAAASASVSAPTASAPPSPSIPPPAVSAPLIPEPTVPAPVTALPIQPPAPPTALKPSGPALGFTAGAGPVFGVADLPDPHAGFSGWVGLRIEEWTLEGGVHLGIGSTGVVASRPDSGADFTLIVGLLRTCRALVPWFARPWPRPQLRLDLDACVGIELGSLSGQGFGIANPERGEAVWVAPRLDLRTGLGIVGPLSLALDVGVVFPVDRRRFIIEAGDGTLVVHEPGPAAGRLGISADLEL